MSADWLRDLLQLVTRMLPWPTPPGLRSVGSPGPESPVILTGNYDLTVRRLTRALQGLDAWVVVAPSRGINVWCAAAGGHLSSHQVVTALKTSGVAEQVSHREVILPQLAATGVLALEIFRRCRWRVRFGPVRAEDLPDYLSSGEKSDAMRRVRFGAVERMEMAAVWALPVSLLLGSAAWLLRPTWALPLMGLCAALSVAVFGFYDRLGYPRLAFPAGATALALAVTAAAGGGGGALLAALVAPGLLTLLLTFDYAGSTPLEGGSHFDQRAWTLRLDAERCKGVYRCLEVCPEACFEKVPDERRVVLAHDERCIRCGACVVQCPQDALFFEDGQGQQVLPEVVRRFKLNLLGQRAVDLGSGAPGAAGESAAD